MPSKFNLKTSPIRGQACCCKSSPRCSANFRRAVSSFSSPEELGFPRIFPMKPLGTKHLELLKFHQAFHNLTLAVSYLTGRLDLTKRGWMLFGGLVCGGCGGWGGFSWWHLIEKSLGIGKELRPTTHPEFLLAMDSIQRFMQKASWNFVIVMYNKNIQTHILYSYDCIDTYARVFDIWRLEVKISTWLILSVQFY